MKTISGKSRQVKYGRKKLKKERAETKIMKDRK